MSTVSVETRVRQVESKNSNTSRAPLRWPGPTPAPAPRSEEVSSPPRPHRLRYKILVEFPPNRDKSSKQANYRLTQRGNIFNPYSGNYNFLQILRTILSANFKWGADCCSFQICHRVSVNRKLSTMFNGFDDC